MKVTCHLCGVEFEKADKEVRRQQKEGRDYFFCSRSCTGIHANKIRHNTPDDGLKSYHAIMKQERRTMLAIVKIPLRKNGSYIRISSK